jgi:hypothetical protein
MNRPKKIKSSGKGLRNAPDNPTNQVRVMQVNSATIVPFFPVVIGTSSDTDTATVPAPTPTQIDRALLHVSAESFTNLVNTAKAYPEVRSDLVSSFKSQVANGSYPSEETVSGLTRLLSGSAE